MLNYIWLALIALAVLLGGFNGRLQEVTEGAVEGAGDAVTLALGLVGLMALWLGLMRLADKSGLVRVLANRLQPLLGWLFPEVPAQHPAMGSMLMNISANMLGLTNAATPLGLRAMKDLESLNRTPGTATNAMCMFLAINTGSVQLIPMTAIAILAAAGSVQPTAIVGTALIATLCSSVVGIAAAKFFERIRPVRSAPDGRPPSPEQPGSHPVYEGVSVPQPPPHSLSLWQRLVLAGFLACFVWFFLVLVFPVAFGSAVDDSAATSLFVRVVQALSILAIPFLIAFFPLYAVMCRIPVYEEFVEGAKEGFQVALRIIPFLVAILVATKMFRGAGGIELMTQTLGPLLDSMGFPPDLLPMALMRPLSGTGSLGIFSEMVGNYGPDSLVVRMAGTLLGSTETTLYVVALYFGAVSIRRTRHAVPAGLMADATGIIASVVICRWVFT